MLITVAVIFTVCSSEKLCKIHALLSNSRGLSTTTEPVAIYRLLKSRCSSCNTSGLAAESRGM